jgi:hypothetical protein
MLRFIIPALTLAAAGSAHAGMVESPFTIDFFPSGVKNNNIIQLVFFGPGNGPNEGVGYEITNTTLFITFTTAGGFDAADLNVLLVAPAGNEFILFEGSEFGWSGQGSFTETVSFSDLNGAINPGLWTFDVTGDTPNLTYSGAFSADTRWEVELAPVPGPGGLAALGLLHLLGRRRRRAF